MLFHNNLKWPLIVLAICILPALLNLLGVDFASHAVQLESLDKDLNNISKDDEFKALSGALHHAFLEWSAVSLAIFTAIMSFLHYYRHGDITVPIIGFALLCAGITDAFHVLAATRIISANAPNTDFIPFTWAFSRIFNVTLMIVGVSLSLWLNYRQRIDLEDISSANLHVHNRSTTGVLFIIGASFILFSVTAVLLAATSENLPQTTFPTALITRPYDVLPLALFLFSAVLVWHWQQNAKTYLPYALLLSLMPEIATQIHMSFGSTQLFDNHFNIAHGLKVAAYLILAIGMLFHLAIPISDTYMEQNLRSSTKKNTLRRILHKIPDLVDVGTAKYPQALLIPAFTFVLAIVVTVAVSSIFYIDTIKLTHNEQLKEFELHGFYVETLIKESNSRTKDELIFLSHTPPIQGIISAIKKRDSNNYKKWTERLSIIFSEIIKSESSFESIVFIDASNNNLEIVKSYRILQNVFSIPTSRLSESTDTDVRQYSPILEGQVSYAYAPLDSIDDFCTEAVLNLIIPIYDRVDGKYFGLIKLQVNFANIINWLEQTKTIDRELFLASSNGLILYQEDSTINSSSKESNPATLQELFPQLQPLINSKKESARVGNTTSINSSKNTMGYYRSIKLPSGGKDNILRLFIHVDDNVNRARLDTFRFRSLLIGFSLSIVALALATIVSRGLTRALQQTTAELLRYSYTGEIGNLPLTAQDETGVLARSFHNMQVLQAVKEKELLQQKNAMDEHNIVSTTDVKGNITYINDNFIRISDYSPEELLGKNHRLLNSRMHDNYFYKNMYRTITQGDVWQGEICNINKQGEKYWVHSTIVPYLNAQGKPEQYISIQSDITENKNNLQYLADARDLLSDRIDALQNANAELDQFAYIASHDLKSPLNGITQLVTWLEEDCVDILPEESKQHLFLLRSRSTRMINLLSDLLEYSRVGKQNHNAEPLYLAALCEDIFELQGNRQGFTLTAPNIELYVQKTPFELVIRNLISNALKHHDAATGKIEITMEESKEYFHIRVSDDGPGIPPDLQSKALEMFQTLQSRDKKEGSGMGLALVKKTVMYHGGTIEIESDGGRGTTIVVNWPKQNKVNS